MNSILNSSIAIVYLLSRSNISKVTVNENSCYHLKSIFLSVAPNIYFINTSDQLITTTDLHNLEKDYI